MREKGRRKEEKKNEKNVHSVPVVLDQPRKEFAPEDGQNMLTPASRHQTAPDQH